MAAPVAGLSPAELAGIRQSLATGKRPKVVFTARAGQMAGNAGQVIELTDPAGSDEWIVVRFGRDELPFSPADLAISGRGTAAGARAKPVASTAKPAAVRPEPARVTPAPPPRPATVREENPVPARRTPDSQAAEPSVNGPQANRLRANEPRANEPRANEPRGREPRLRPSQARAPQAPVTPPAPPVNGAAPNGGSPNGGAANGGASSGAKAPRSPRPPKVVAPLVVTLTYADQRWTVAAHHGSKTLAKPYPVTPAEAMGMVGLIDVPGVHDAVAGIIAAERVEAEKRAQRLRSELAEIESRLAELSRRA